MHYYVHVCFIVLLHYSCMCIHVHGNILLPTLPIPYMTLCVIIRPRSENLEILESQLILGLRDTIISEMF